MSTVVALIGLGLGYWYFFVKVEAASKAAHESLTELADGPTRRSAPLRAGHKVLVNKYYLDHLYTGVIAGGTKGPLADGAYWVNQHVIDGAVNLAGTTAVTAGRLVYEQFDQKVVDGLVNGSGFASEASGGELRKIQTGKVQQYAALLFLGATVLAGVLIIVI